MWPKTVASQLNTEQEGENMKVYVYRETNDNEVFGGELVKVFADRESAEAFLKDRVEMFFEKPWDEVVELIEELEPEGEGLILPSYVEYLDGNGFNFFAVDEHKLEGKDE